MRGKEVPSSKKPISKGLKALIDRKHSVRLIHYRQFPSLPRCRTEVFGWHCAHPAFPPTSSRLAPAGGRAFLCSEAVAMGRTPSEMLIAGMFLLMSTSHFVWLGCVTPPSKLRLLVT